MAMTTIPTCNMDLKGLRPVAKFQPEKYLGLWFELARLPTVYERGLTNVTARYTALPGAAGATGAFRIENSGTDAKTGEVQSIVGQALPTPALAPSVFCVSFQGIPMPGQLYVVLAISTCYNIALVAVPNRDALWILSRTTAPLPKRVVALLLEAAVSNGYSPAKLCELQWTAHQCH